MQKENSLHTLRVAESSGHCLKPCSPTPPTSLPPLKYPDGSVAYQPQEKAKLFVDLFAANCRIVDSGKHPNSIPTSDTIMRDIRIRRSDVRAELQSLDVRKASAFSSLHWSREVSVWSSQPVAAASNAQYGQPRIHRVP